MVSTELRTRIRYPLIWHKGTLRVKLGGKTYEFEFERKWVKRGDNALGGFDTADEVELLGDRHGRVAYTDVRIRMDGDLPSESPQRMLSARVIARAVINRVLQVYRVDTSEAHIEPISEADLGHVVIQQFDDDGARLQKFEAVESFVGGLQSARYAKPSSDAVGTLEKGLGTPFPWVLLLDAQRELIFGKSREAVIHAQTAVEVAVQRAVQAYYEDRGEDEESIANKLDAGLKNLLKDHIPRATKADFWGTELRERWSSRAYEMRNRAVHRGGAVSRNEAKAALLVCRDVVVWIGQRTMWLAPEAEAATLEEAGADR